MKYLCLLLVTFVLGGVVYCQGTWTSYTTANSNIPFDKIICLNEDNQNNIWVGNNVSGGYNHIAVFDNNVWNGYFTNDWVYDISTDTNGNTWTVHNMELKKWDGGNWTSYSSGLLDFWTHPIHADKKGNVWCYTQTSNLLIQYDGNNFTSITSGMGLPTANILCMESDLNGLYLGTLDSGLVYYDGFNWTCFNSTNSAMPVDDVSAMRFYGDTLWMACSGNNLVKYANGVFIAIQNTYLSGSIKELDIDKSGNVWIAVHGNGIVKYDGLNFELFNYSAYPVLDPFENYHCLEADQNGNIWVGTQTAGLLRYTPDSLTSAGYDDKERFNVACYPNPAINSIHFDFKLPEKANSGNLIIMNGSGKLVWNSFVKKGQVSVLLSVEKFSPGTYFYYISTEVGVSQIEKLQILER